MQAMIATQTQTQEPGLELTALSPAGHPIPAESRAPSVISTTGEDFEPTLLRSESYDTENAQIGIATIANIPRKPISDHIRLKVREIKSNKIARRTLKAMIIFGIIASLFQLTSLGPQIHGAYAAAAGLKTQMKGEADARQNIAFAFQSNCMNRKVQNLPLGADCLKYLELTPKAPADIDKWMMDPPAANASDSVLVVREIKPSDVSRPFDVPPPSDVPRLNETLLIPTPRAQQLPSRKILYAAAFVNGCFITILFFFIRSPDALWQILSWLDRHIRRVLGFEIFTIIGEFLQSLMGKRMLYLIKFVLFSLLLFDIYATVLLWNSQYLVERWSATSEFLKTCKMQQDLDLPLGDDCRKYMAKELKPRPAQTWFDTATLVFSITQALLALGGIITTGLLIRRSRPIRALISLFQPLPSYESNLPLSSYGITNDELGWEGEQMNVHQFRSMTEGLRPSDEHE